MLKFKFLKIIIIYRPSWRNIYFIKYTLAMFRRLSLEATVYARRELAKISQAGVTAHVLTRTLGNRVGVVTTGIPDEVISLATGVGYKGWIWRKKKLFSLFKASILVLRVRWEGSCESGLITIYLSKVMPKYVPFFSVINVRYSEILWAFTASRFPETKHYAFCLRII